MSIPYEGDSTNPGIPGIKGTNSGSGVGVLGTSTSFDAVVGETGSDTHAGVTGRNLTNGGGNGGVGIYGVGGRFAGKFDGAVSVTLSPPAPIGATSAILAEAQTGVGSVIESVIFAKNFDAGTGVIGSVQENGRGVLGLCSSDPLGVLEIPAAANNSGVTGFSNTGVGVFGHSNQFDAVVGETSSVAHAGVTGRNLAIGGNGVGIYGVGVTAGKFDGDLQVNGNANITGNLTGPTISNLEQQVTQLANLEQQVTQLANLEQQVTQLANQVAKIVNWLNNTQAPPIVQLPFSPPEIFLGIVNPGGAGPGGILVSITGQGFDPNAHTATVVIKRSDGGNVQTFTSDVVGGGLTAPSGAGFPTFPYMLNTANRGLTYYVAATDGRPNPQDWTGQSWSNTVSFNF